MSEHQPNIAKITFSYDGSAFCGLVKQEGKKSIEQEMLNALKRLNILSKIIFSGRTDKGVHATNQVCSIKLPTFWCERLNKDIEQNKYKENKNTLLCQLNKMLPSSILIKKISLKDSFHARFDAKKRIYRYILSQDVSVFESNYIHKIENELDESIIKQAIPYIVGVHNFEAFCKREEKEKNKIREVYYIRFYHHYIGAKKIWVFTFCANAYLRSQIRMFVSFFIKLSNKQLSIDDLKRQLNGEKISNSPIGANGLYLLRIIY